MAKYHVNKAGEPGQCSAQRGGCPFGGEQEHYSSLTEAYDSIAASSSTFSSVTKSEPELDIASEMVEQYAQLEDVDPEVAEEIELALASISHGDKLSAWWALDRATQVAGYDDRHVKPYVDAYRDMISPDGNPPKERWLA